MSMATGRAGFHENLLALNSAQKPGGGVPAYMRWVNRRAGRVIAAASARIGLTPNAVTAISAALSAAGLAVLLIAGSGWWPGPVAAVLLAAGFAFDSADGQLARLTSSGGPAGEWLDHVVDAVRTPTVHLVIAVSLTADHRGAPWAVGVALCFCVVSVGQFMSQILAEQLVRQRDREETESSAVTKSLMLLPTDTGTLCWLFVLWGWSTGFCVAYTAVFGLNLIHTAVSMRRKYVKLSSLRPHGVPAEER